MKHFPKPILVASKCLEFEACRWNGVKLPEPLIKKLEPLVRFIPTCPEFEIGLGIPRDPIRIVLKGSRHHLMQPATGRDVTREMNEFSSRFLASLGPVDGFILKSRSPSCGIKDVKVYPSIEKSMALDKRAGFFGAAAMDIFPDIAIEDEGRLSNYRIREHYLTRVFAYAAWRETRQTMGQLVAFHSSNKLLLMAYNQQAMRQLGKIVANHLQKSVADVFTDYGALFKKALGSMPRYTSNINVLMHALGYFSTLTKSEKAHFLKVLDKYRDGKLPLSAALGIVQSWIVRFDEKYLAQQTFFEPYPEALIEITDSGKGRDS